MQHVFFPDLIAFVRMAQKVAYNCSVCKTLNGNACTLARKRGLPMVVQKKRSKCEEYRCATHCKCGRNGQRDGRLADRTASAKVVSAVRVHAKALASAKTQPKANTSAAYLVATMSTVTAHAFYDHYWARLVVADIAVHNSAVLACDMFDIQWIQHAFLHRLDERPPFK